MNIPNALTLLRFLLIFVFVYVFYLPDLFWMIVVLFIAGLTDLLDGYIARKYNMVTKWGKMLDPLVDKALLITTLACLYSRNMIPLLVIVVVVLKELLMVSTALFLYKNRKIVIQSNIYGKLSTMSFYFAIFLIFFRDRVAPYGEIFLYTAVSLALYACFQYAIVVFNNEKR